MLYYYADKKAGPYFEGWYLKCQTKAGKTLALIPAIHIDKAGTRNASIQVISEEQSWWLKYPGDSFSAATELFRVQIENNIFSAQGIELNIHADGINLEGRIIFSPFSHLKYPIMGPFQFVPNMQCAHGVISMRHTLKGELLLNDVRYDFSEGTGYIESDRGSSFPSAYLWAQDVWAEGSFMLAIARIPFGKLSFTGCICAILINGREYRIATYLGAKVKQWSSHDTEIEQGRYRLELKVLNKRELPLKAPDEGKMVRTIQESVSSALRIRITQGKKVLVDRLTYCAGFEYYERQ